MNDDKENLSVGTDNRTSQVTTVSQKGERINHLVTAVPSLADMQAKTMGEVNAAMLDMVINTITNLNPAEQGDIQSDEESNEQSQDSLEPDQRKNTKAVRKVKSTR